MSSIHSAFSQVSAYKRFVATATTTLYDADGASLQLSLAAGTVLVDMGKTVHAPAGLLRKVAVVPTPDTASYGTGYIFLGSSIPAGQKVAALF